MADALTGFRVVTDANGDLRRSRVARFVRRLAAVDAVVVARLRRFHHQLALLAELADKTAAASQTPRVLDIVGLA